MRLLKNKTCKNCKYWDNEMYNSAICIIEYRKCMCPQMDVFYDSGDNDGVSVDCRGDVYGLETGENFGCIHFEKK